MRSGEKFVGDASERVYVIARIGQPAGQKFAARVCRRYRRERIPASQDALHTLPGGGARGAEIEYSNFSGIGNHDVVRLQVHVNHVAGMGVRKTRADLPYDRPGLGPRHRPRLQPLHHRPEQLPLEQLHGKKIHVAVPIEFINLDDIAVREHLRTVKFAPQVFEQLRAIIDFLVQDLDGDVLIRAGQIGAVPVQCLENGAHTAATQALLENISVPQDAANFNGRGSAVMVLRYGRMRSRRFFQIDGRAVMRGREFAPHDRRGDRAEMFGGYFAAPIAFGNSVPCGIGSGMQESRYFIDELVHAAVVALRPVAGSGVGCRLTYCGRASFVHMRDF